MALNGPGGNGKDPWGGGGKKQTPPDLDEALRKLQQRLAKYMRKGGGKGPGLPSTKGGAIGLSLILVAIVILWALSGIYIVGPAEQAVVLRFGRYIDTVNPGPHWIPRFIDSKQIVNVQSVSNFSYTSEMLTKDENIVSVALAIQYRIGNPKDYLFNVVSPRESLQQATASALRQVVGHSGLDAILTVGREKVRSGVAEQLNRILSLYATGILVTDVAMQPAKAPEQVKSAFDDAIKAQEDEQRFVNQAQAYTARVLPIAEGNAKRIFQEADAYKKQIILKAQGDVARFSKILPEYKRAPRVTRERLYLGTVEHILSNTTKILMDTKGTQNLVYLPLDKILNQTGGNLPQHTAQATSKDNSKMTTIPSRRGRALGTERSGRESYRGRGDY